MLSDGRGEEFFYRVTGEDIKLYRSRGRRGLGPGSKLRWDTITGGDKVGGALEGLSLKGSAYDTTIDSAAGIAYSEWTITFGNTYFSDREARMRLALPLCGTVSRLTLWINGEECEAAFGGRGQVRRAYEQIVSRHRDPVLVTTCGPDEVQVVALRIGRAELLVLAGEVLRDAHHVDHQALVVREDVLVDALQDVARAVAVRLVGVDEERAVDVAAEVLFGAAEGDVGEEGGEDVAEAVLGEGGVGHRVGKGRGG